jgi:thiol-disulfide isomerase/thioredoxin
MKHIALAIALAAGLPGPAQALEAGQKAPELRLGLPGSETLASLRGQVVYLDFWASYCGPCKRSFPWMNEMHDRYAAKGLRVVSVNLDPKRADAERFLAQHPARFGVAFDPAQESPARFEVKAMPSSLLIGPDGRVIRVHAGFHDDQREELERAIQQALNVSR